MQTPEWERLRARFHDALTRGPEGRAALLRDIAADDEGLAREVASLLAAHAAADGFLDARNDDDGNGEDEGEGEGEGESDGTSAASRPTNARPGELAPGDRLGVFEILATAGRGGMGDVYQARDLRLGRIVAVKVLPARHALDGRAADGQARERFEREARAISRLTHPHICTLYDVGSASPAPGAPELPFLVMEFLEGRTLADRLKDGPLDPDEALRHGLAIVDALAAAHAQGIVHRDLKPGNVMLTAAGVKLLDFGLAQLHAGGIGLEDGAERDAPTRSTLSSRGLIAGTLRYMSPEQLRGQATDARSDVFACGVLLHELLTGRPPFDAADDASVIAGVLAGTPPPIETDGSPLGRRLTPIVARCLEKAPDHRWPRMIDLQAALIAARDARDGRDGREEEDHDGDSSGGSRTRTLAVAPRGGRWWDWRRWREHGRRGGRVAMPRGIVTASILLLLAAVVALIAVLVTRAQDERPQPARQGLTRASIVPPEGIRFDAVQISPDGRQIAFAGWSPQGARLWVRALDADTAQPIAGTEGAQGPVFWAPDSRHVAFVLKDTLVALDTVTRTTRVICDVGHLLSGTWSVDGVILFDAVKAPQEGLWRVAATGGRPSLIRRPGGLQRDGGGAGGAYLFPHFLPDGKQYLFSLQSPDPQRAGVYLAKLDTDKPATRVLASPSPVQYVAAGYLLFMRDNAITAQRFDPGSGRVQGEAILIVRTGAPGDPRRQLQAYSSASVRLSTSFSASQTGVLAHAMNPFPLDQLAWYDREGRRQQTVGEPAPYAGFSLSRDETRVAATRPGPQRQRMDLWTLDLTSGVSSRLTFGGTNQFDPRWSPDGRRIGVAALRDEGRGLEKLLMAVGLDGRETPLYQDPAHSASFDDWSPDGRTLLYHSDDKRELLAVPVDGSRPPALIWRSPSAFPPDQARFSPDGRWIAYHALDSGRPEVYVTRYPAAGERIQVSSAGGVQPMWRGDGRELYYLGLDGRLFAVPMASNGRLQPAAPQALFQTPIGPSQLTEQYAADKTGARFLLMEPDPHAPAPIIDLVIDWPSAFTTGR